MAGFFTIPAPTVHARTTLHRTSPAPRVTGMSVKFGVELQDAVGPLVLALDVGSTASRGMIFDAHGRPAGRRAKVPHAFTSAPDGTSTIDPDQVVAELRTIITELTASANSTPIAAVALDTFASSLIALDGEGLPLTPCFTYADGRCGSQVSALRGEVGEPELQQLTGTRLHFSYWPARLRWLAARPEAAQARRYVSLGDYVLLRLIGTLATGTSAAAWTGMVDRRSAAWSPQVLRLAGVEQEQLSPIHHLDEPVPVASAAADRIATDWPAIAGATWYAPIADGLAANVGLGALDETTMGGSCATSGALRVLVRELPDALPGGLWCYRVSHDRALVGGALNDVGRALAWAEDAFGIAHLDPARVSAALAAPTSRSTPLVLPFFSGERSTGWAAQARAVFTGVSVADGPVEMFRGVAEGLALSYARMGDQLRVVAPGATELVVGGRVASDRPELLRLMAEAMGMPVTPVPIKRSTLHGTALLALETIAPGVERTAPPRGDTLEPDAAAQRYFASRAEEFARVYAATLE